VTIDERTRHQMHTAFEHTFGPEVAAALMEHLPPTGWADVATKHDLGQLEERLDLRIHALGNELRSEFQRDLRHQGWAVFGGLSVMMGLVTALGRLL
jgi:hypothetical protein